MIAPLPQLPATTPPPAADERDRARALLSAVGAGAVALAACLPFVPAVVNGDGLGYLRAAPTTALVPGHLGYLPLLRLLANACGARTPLAILPVGRALSLASAALAAALLHDAARRLLPARSPAPWVASLGMAASFATLQAGSDVETYGPALAAVCLATACAARRREGGGPAWSVATAIAVALATLLHVENALLAPAAALLAAGAGRSTAGRDLRWRDAIAIPAGAGALVLLAYGAALVGRAADAAGAVRWFLGAGHGLGYPLRWWTPLAALHGLAKTLVYAPYPAQAGWRATLVDNALGLAAIAAAVAIARLVLGGRQRAPRLGLAVAASWSLPYALVGLAFYGSDNERWIFLLPLAWLLVARGAATSSRALRGGLALAAALLATNLALALPAARDPSLRERADAAAERMRAGDLVVSPGHSWDEYVGFYRPLPGGGAIESFPMVYYCGQLGGAEAMRAALDRAIADARRRGARVFVARAGEPESADGWKDLARFGVHPASLDRWLPAGKRVPVAPGLEELR